MRDYAPSPAPRRASSSLPSARPPPPSTPAPPRRCASGNARSAKQLLAWFNALDVDSDKRISMVEFFAFSLKEAFGRIGASGTGSAHSGDEILQSFDKDGDGALDRHEFYAFAKKLGFEAVADELRDAQDTDGSGTISFHEIMHHVSEMSRHAQKVSRIGNESHALLKEWKHAESPHEHSAAEGIAHIDGATADKMEALAAKVEAQETSALRSLAKVEADEGEEVKELLALLRAFLREHAPGGGPRAEAIFKSLDEKGDRLIHEGEFRHALKAMGFNHSGVAQQLFDLLDTDASFTISYRELSKWLNE